MTNNGLDYPLQPLERFLIGTDLAIANLEGPVTTNQSVSLNSRIGHPNNTTFTFDPAAVRMLADRGVTTVSLANNHTDNFGAAGWTETKQHLDEIDLAYFGHPNNLAGELSMIETVRGITVGLVGYHGIWQQDASAVVAEIERLTDQVDFLLVYPHWGREYQRQPSAFQQQLAHQFIDAGADAVIGAHSHVVQPIEMYNGKAIFYGLGNFLFDQNFSAETSESLAVGIDWRAEQITYHLFPLITRDFQTQLPPPAYRHQMLHWLTDNSPTASLSIGPKQATLTLENQ